MNDFSTLAVRIRTSGILLETFYAIFQGTVDFKYIMQLKKFEKFHDFGIDIAYLEEAIIVIGSLHNGKKYTKTSTVNKINSIQVENKFGFGFVKISL